MDIKNSNTIEASQHFNNLNHVFKRHEKFILIEQLNNIKKYIFYEVLKQRLENRKNYWIKKLKTLTPFGLNQEINLLHGMQYFFCSLLFLLSTYGLNMRR